jgi:aldehyde dehydrogenase (NAD+)
MSIEEQIGMYIGGNWVNTDDKLEIINPSNGKSISKVPNADHDHVDTAVEYSRKAFEDSSWRELDPTQRGRILRKISDKTYEIAKDLAKIESINQGKTFRDALSDIRFAAWTIEYYAGWTDKIEGNTIPVPGERLDYTLKQPLGVTAHIIPWNFPFQLGVRSIAPALAAGCTVIAKPASLTPLSLLTWFKHIQDLGLPDNVLQIITGSGGKIGNYLTRHSGVDGIALTGSVETGKNVMRQAAENLTPVSLELGGKGANIIFEDANPKIAAKALNFGAFWNAGEMCWAGSRAIVHESIIDEVLSYMKEELQTKWKLGPGLEEGVRMGPLVSESHRSEVMELTQKGIEQGATLFLGGDLPQGELSEGYFMNPTIVTDLKENNLLLHEEVFGPVLSVLSFSDDDEALRLANDTKFGLLNGLFTNNLKRTHRFARDLQSGMITVNEFPVTFPQTPFVGWKHSGIGAEQGQIALDFYTKTKNVNINFG